MIPANAGPSRRGSAIRLEYGAALWSLIFAMFHMVWALGWYVGLEAETARRAFQSTWMFVYDIVAAALCVLGIFLALAFVRPWGQRLPRRLVDSICWCAAGLLLLRSGGSVAQIIYFAGTGKLRTILHPMALWELWFYAGTLLFCLSFRRFRTRARPKAVGHGVEAPDQADAYRSILRQ